ncbi:acyl-CoA thioesterase II [Leucobacter sp. OH2974_COT-288]|uniref:Acyl-CoA thioesterase-2 n=1 Tax=Canibacter oris TaxID=1365628 RepID=A0A840DQW7_9MICO|nr:acyl-CoA thioesterase domain-containing protein [Canibacter oris]MBB4071919.1 acyl-CoA thioesterase-2 [Canibacter oris]RRD36066.1 acyl-CoA thioesterase II [Leucobacter sp. OH2974_COT-288]
MSNTSLSELLTVASQRARTTHDIFVGQAHPTASGRSFGGQIMGQAAYAAGATVDPDRELHSLHGYFLRPGVASAATTFEVDSVFTGGSFATRRAQAFQNGETIMSLIASFQRPAEQPGFADTLNMREIPEPQQLASLSDTYQHLAADHDASFILQRPFEFRYVDSDVFTTVAATKASQRVWLKTVSPLRGTQLLQKAALTFASDYMFIEPVLRGYGVPWTAPGLKVASLDLAIWFHTEVNVDDWLLYDLRCVHAAGGRALTQGRFFNQAGELVASCAQEVMVRLPGNTGPRSGLAAGTHAASPGAQGSHRARTDAANTNALRAGAAA